MLNRLLTNYKVGLEQFSTAIKVLGQHYHKLSFLADIGVKHNDPDVNKITERVFEHTSPQGPFQFQ
jgi:hypothetical protein